MTEVSIEITAEDLAEIKEMMQAGCKQYKRFKQGLELADHIERLVNFETSLTPAINELQAKKQGLQDEVGALAAKIAELKDGKAEAVSEAQAKASKIVADAKAKAQVIGDEAAAKKQEIMAQVDDLETQAEALAESVKAARDELAALDAQKAEALAKINAALG